MQPTILAIESSCDETSAAVIQNGKVLNNVIATQSIHEIYGGVVPELASRAHQQHIIPIVASALKEAKIKSSELDAIAFTRGPGLLGALLVGASFAKGLAMALDIPLIAVNHMKAHILAHFIDDPKPEFPFLCLTVSGGHTQIVKVNNPLDMEILGETRDDAVGEAFDKCAKIIDLPYPGGPHIDKLAMTGNPNAFTFGKADMDGLDFSFSGIKTSFLYFIRDQMKNDQAFITNNINDIAASLQKNLIDMLLEKLIQASKKFNINQIAIAGGVAANKGLRTRLEEESQTHHWKVFIPEFQYCTDNAGMIAMAAHFQFLEGDFSTLDITPDPRLPFSS
ncbi:MAG: tRNA (adenosine(37)-N6)-threonylcarbamoyltransferase complex transferase subunit TsaD [Cyclobacteriaceae bacterium]|nr:tRNA (adenosine(37)-N6)-threonylcarbamoyltransferase complex transferase subunit TsaD [Cyclobacteriaceae bacterium]